MTMVDSFSSRRVPEKLREQIGAVVEADFPIAAIFSEAGWKVFTRVDLSLETVARRAVDEDDVYLIMHLEEKNRLTESIAPPREIELTG